MKKLLLLVLACSPILLAAQDQLPPAASVKVDYDQQVRPLLAQNCYSCHGPEVQQSGLRLDLRQNALRGGDYGPVITPGNSAESKLIRRLVNGDGGLQMPPTGSLSDEEIGVLRAWIDQGAEFRTEIAEEQAPKPVDPKIQSFIAAIRGGDAKSVDARIAESPGLVTSKDLMGTTPLHHAAGFGTLQVMQLLLDKGADVNARNRRGSTPLHWAIHDAAKVRLLVSRGAAVNTKSIEGRTPVYQAAVLANGHEALRLLLASGADPQLATLIGQTPLMVAAVRGDVEAMRLLIEKGADVNTKNSAGETALMAAATNGSPEAVRLLLDKGADATVRSKRTETALGNTATAGVEETVRLLLEKGAEVNIRNIRGYSPLMLAAASDALPAGAVKLLLARGAESSYSADYDETARMLASKRGDTEVTRLLGGISPDIVPPSEPTTLASNPRAGSIAEAVEKATALMAKQSHTFIRTAGCNSCHSQDLPSAAAGYARGRGIPQVSEIPQLPASMLPSPERIMDLNIVSVNSISWELFDFGMNDRPKDAYTDGVVRFIRAMQLPEGNWSSNEGRRPPMNAGDFQTAALAIFAMKHYSRDADRAASEGAIAKAVKWLESAKPTGTQDRAFHLLGLAWGNGSPAVIKTSSRSLAALQRADGGWSQMPTLASDAYATGQVLYALNTTKMAVTDPAYRKGIDYLMRSQAEDGSWHVKTRSIWLQPYFESGFPYARDQFISTAGTAWATFALAPAADPKAQTKKMTRR
jgi:ankyrin repeat protein/mono/diheme cytochrome c family protein